MRTKNYKGRTTKKKLSKCSDVARLYDELQIAYSDILENDSAIKSFRVNVPLDGEECCDYTTDFLCEKTDGDYCVRECVFRKNMTLPRTIKLLQLSQTYWLKHGIADWGIVVEKEITENETE